LIIKKIPFQATWI